MPNIDWALVDQLRRENKTIAEIASIIGVNANSLRARISDRQRSLKKEESFKRLLELAKTSRDWVNTVDPIFTSEHVGVFSDTIAVVFISCLHLGSRYTDYDKLEKFVNSLRNSFLYCVMLGDDVDGYEGFSDIATATEQAISSPLVQREFLRLFIENIGYKRILAAFSGQHGAQWQRRSTGSDPIKEIYRSFGIPYFDGQAFLHLTVGEFEYTIFASHKLPGRVRAFPLAAQLKAANTYASKADLVVMGDSHISAVMEYRPESFGDVKSKWLAQVGTLKTGNDPYTIRSFTNGQFGYPVFVFSGKNRQISYAGSDLPLSQIWAKL